MKPSDDETQLWISLNRAHRRIHRDMETHLAAQGLPSLRWYDILWSVELAGRDGSKAVDLVDRLLFEQSNLSRILRSMVQQQLVEERSSPTDQRAKILTITPQGKDLRRRMWKVYGPLIHKHMSEIITSSETNVLSALGAETSD